ncbi:MAG: GFA family protein [Pseudomonadota bacterium]
MTIQLAGNCLCGDVRFTAAGEVKRVSACYCSQCRQQNGGSPFHGIELQGELTVDDSSSLRWYASSPQAKRAFCARCGSSLFWRSNDDVSFFDVSMGAIGDDHGLSLDAHIFVDYCPSYLTVPSTAPHLTEADVRNRPLKNQ